MPKKADDEKFDAQLLVMLTGTRRDELRAVAKANGTTAAEMLRRASEAIIRCHNENGVVPMDMQLIQRPITTRLGAASEEELGNIIQERLEHTKWGVNDAGQLAAELAAEITRRSHPDPKRKIK